MFVSSKSPAWSNTIVIDGQGNRFYEVSFLWEGREFTIRVSTLIPPHLVPVLVIDEALQAIKEGGKPNAQTKL